MEKKCTALEYSEKKVKTETSVDGEFTMLHKCEGSADDCVDDKNLEIDTDKINVSVEVYNSGGSNCEQFDYVFIRGSKSKDA